ncbi:hypothetical protein [uncultured Kordia sp.]|uniref:hypothetical protein n=1 Tax=uncultured Kordia sp. TaxID=507699 RepID=UPI0026302739|nr:hypothetical protein [uncultured Kordia sp.]
MKKQQLKTLKLNKSSISTLESNTVKGGCPSLYCQRSRDASCILSCNGMCQ